MTWLYQWATSESGKGPREMPTVDELRRDGFEPAGKDPRYPTILMRKACSETGATA